MTEYTSENKRFCSVYKSPKKAEMYVYLDRKTPVTELPEALQQVFGEPEHVLDMVLTPDKHLARVDAEKVLHDIAEQGFFLQMPPTETEKAGDVAPPTDTLNG